MGIAREAAVFPGHTFFTCCSEGKVYNVTREPQRSGGSRVNEEKHAVLFRVCKFRQKRKPQRSGGSRVIFQMFCMQVRESPVRRSQIKVRGTKS